MVKKPEFLPKENLNDILEICNSTPFKLDDNLKYKHLKIEPSFKLNDEILLNYQIVRKKLNNDSNIPLIVTVGISHNSFCNNLKILNNNIHKIENKYSEIIFFLYEKKIKQQHEQFLKIMKENKDMKKYNGEKQIFVINDIMKKIIATHYDKIIRKIISDASYNEIDLLGVSFGGGVSVFLSQMKTINIRQLILVAPAILEGFKNLHLEQNIILGWCIQDNNKVPFKTDGKRLIQEIKKFNNKIILLTDLGKDEDNDDITHRLQDGIFDII
jgi:hypothetical protein